MGGGGVVVVAEPPQGGVSCVLGTKKEVLGEGSLHLILTEWHRVKGPDWEIATRDNRAGKQCVVAVLGVFVGS